MSLHNFTTDGTKPDWLAAVQQSCLMTSLALNSQSTFQSVLSACGGGIILDWYFDSTTVTPNRAICQQDNKIFVYNYGIQLNTTGALIGAGWLAGETIWGEKVNRVASYQWFHNVKPVVQSKLPAGVSNLQVYFVGYSFGGMVSMVAATDLVNTMNVNNVHLLTFGAPKTFLDPTVGFLQVLPVDFVMFQNEHDPIPFLPTDEMCLIVPVISKFRVGKRSINWKHIKGIWQLQDPVGQRYLPISYWADDWGTGNSIIDFTPHYMPQYVGRTKGARRATA